MKINTYPYNTRENYGYNCRICGYEMDDMPWSENGEFAMYEICPCCGMESGLNDTSPDFVRLNRRDWGVGQNMEWNRPSAKPENWSWEEQKKQIPPAFRDVEEGGWE